MTTYEDDEKLTIFEMSKDISPTTFSYYSIKMENGKRIGECPRGKNIKCKDCSNALISKGSYNDWLCTNLDINNIFLYTTKVYEDGYKMSMVYNDSVLFPGIVAHIEVNGRMEDIQDKEYKDHWREAFANIFTSLIDDAFPITLISE